MTETIKVKDLIKRDIDIDVCDDESESLYIAFCGALELTEEGKKKFADALEYDVTLYEDIAVVHIGDKRLRPVKEFFESAAGYCSVSDWDRWFKNSDD